MEHTIRFILPEDRDELLLCLKAPRMREMIHEWEQWMRSKDKYSETDSIPYSELRAEWFKLKNEVMCEDD